MCEAKEKGALGGKLFLSAPCLTASFASLRGGEVTLCLFQPSRGSSWKRPLQVLLLRRAFQNAALPKSWRWAAHGGQTVQAPGICLAPCVLPCLCPTQRSSCRSREPRPVFRRAQGVQKQSNHSLCLSSGSSLAPVTLGQSLNISTPAAGFSSVKQEV